jgi:hypothetical protein
MAPECTRVPSRFRQTKVRLPSGAVTPAELVRNDAPVRPMMSA